MAIFNPGVDPDYPVPSVGFVQHQCQPQQQLCQQQYYYNGQYVMPTYQQTSAWGAPNTQTLADSRRYDAVPTMTSAPQMAMGQQQQFGFNQLAEQTRRNMGFIPNPQPAQQAPASPWAQQVQQPVPQQQVAYVMPTMQQPTCIQPDDRYYALASTHPSFDKSQGVWNTQAATTVQPVPVVNWGAAQQQPMQYPGFQQNAGQVPMMMAYPTQVAQPMHQNWEQIAQQNFAMK